MNDNSLELEYEGFPLAEAETITAVFVCAQCEGALYIQRDIIFEDVYQVFCPDCGNVERVGRISKTTVAIRNERGVFEFPYVIRALSDLWEELIPAKKPIKQNLKELGF